LQGVNSVKPGAVHPIGSIPLGIKISFGGFMGAGVALILASLAESVLYALYCNSPATCDLYYRGPLSLLGWIAILGTVLSACGLVSLTSSRIDKLVKSRLGISALVLGLTLYALSLLAGTYLTVNGFGGPDVLNITVLVFGFTWSFLLTYAGYFLFRRACLRNAPGGAAGFNLLLVGITIAALGIAMVMNGTVNYVTIYSTMNLSGLGILLSGLGWLTVAFATLRLGRNFG
jgi:hypothetical protein